MSIVQKLILSFLLVALFVGIIGFVGVNTSLETRIKYKQVAHETIPFITALRDLEKAGLRIVASTSEYGFIKGEKKVADSNNTAKPTTEEEELIMG